MANTNKKQIARNNEGIRLIGILKSKGLKHTEIADIIKLDASTITCYLNGSRNITQHTFDKLQAAVIKYNGKSPDIKTTGFSTEHGMYFVIDRRSVPIDITEQELNEELRKRYPAAIKFDVVSRSEPYQQLLEPKLHMQITIRMYYRTNDIRLPR